MIDINQIRENADDLKKALMKRMDTVDFEQV